MHLEKKQLKQLESRRFLSALSKQCEHFTRSDL